MDLNNIGDKIEGARNSPSFESGLGDDSSLSDFEFDSLDLGDLSTDKDKDNIDTYFGGGNNNNNQGDSQSNGVGGFNSFGDGAVLNTGGTTAQPQSRDWANDLGDAFILSSKSSFNIFKSIFKSTKNRIADDWAVYFTSLMWNGGVLAGIGIVIWIISLLLRKPISFTRLPLNSLLTGGLCLGSAMLGLSRAASIILKIDDSKSRIPLNSLPDNVNNSSASDFYDDFSSDGSSDDSDEDDLMDLINSIYDEDGGDDETKDTEDSTLDSIYNHSNFSNNTEDILSSMLNSSTSKRNMSELVPAEVPMINRAFLVDLFKPYLMSSTPDFSKEEHIEAGDYRFKDAEALILSAYASASGKEVEEISNKVYLDSMIDTLFSYEFKVKRANTVRIQEEKLREEIEAYFKSDVHDDTNPDAGSVSASIVKDKDHFRVSVTKSNMKSIVSLGDCMQRSDVVNFFKDNSVQLPIIAGITDKGTPVLEDAKIYDATMVAGKQRSGKSWYVSSLVMQLQLFNTPEDVQFLYIDPKESFMFKSLSLMPHCCGLHNHHRILDILQDIIDLEAPRRKKLLKDNRCETIWDLRKKGIKLPVLYIVIDEYMTIDGYLGDRVSTLQIQMREIMSQMPSLGVRLMFIPHRALGVVDKTARSLINYAAAVKTETSIVEETLDVKKWNRKLTMPGDIALRVGSRTLYVRGAALEKSDDDTINFITQVAKSFYKMGVEIPDMNSIGTGYNRNEQKIKEELEVSTGNKIQYDANSLSSELSNIR